MVLISVLNALSCSEQFVFLICLILLQPLHVICEILTCNVTHEPLSFISVRVQLEDMNLDEASENVAVELAAQGVIGKRVDQMESSFMMALDYMIQLAEKDQDDKVSFPNWNWKISSILIVYDHFSLFIC